MNYIYCGKCGAKVDASFSFCNACGSPLVKGETQPIEVVQADKVTEVKSEVKAESNSVSKKSNLKVNVAVVLVIAVMVSTISFFSGRRNELEKVGNTTTEDNVTAGEQIVVNNYVEAGADEVVIPDLVGTDVEAAKSLLIAQGVVPKENFVFSASYAKGYIDSSMPSAGKVVKKGSTVELNISKAYKKSVAVNAGGEVTNIQFDDGGWQINSVTIDSGILTLQATFTGAMASVNFEAFFLNACDNVKVFIDKGTTQVVGSYTTTVPLDFVQIPYACEETYTQVVVFTADLQAFENFEEPNYISLTFPVLDNYWNRHEPGWENDQKHYEYAKMNVTVNSWSH